MNRLEIITLPLGPMNVNCYLVRDRATGDGCVIDPGGGGGTVRLILDRAAEAGIRITRILLTHAHFDHMSSLEKLREVTGAPLTIHENERAALADPEISGLARWFGVTEPCRPAEHTVRDGDRFFVGETEFTVLHTPGHTVGSVCYLADDALFSGDTLFAGTVGRWDFFGGDEEVLMQSLAGLKKLGDSLAVLPGHGEPTDLGTEKRENPFLLRLN